MGDHFATSRPAATVHYQPSACRDIVELAIVSGSAVALPVHFHGEDQVTVVLSGRRRFEIDGRVVEVESGEAVLIEAGIPHSSLDEPDGVVCLNAYLSAGGSRRDPCRVGSVTGAAVAAGMSREGFSRAFRRDHGVAPSVFRSLLRLNEARLLLRSGAPLAATAAAAGFADQSHLGRRFRRAFGVTPGLYRAAWAGSHPFQTRRLGRL